jgi:hypothetical protein
MTPYILVEEYQIIAGSTGAVSERKILLPARWILSEFDKYVIIFTF